MKRTPSADDFVAKKYRVLSEVSSKAGILISPNKWTSMMQQELAAGSWKVTPKPAKQQRGHLPSQRHRHTALVRHFAKVLEDILWDR